MYLSWWDYKMYFLLYPFVENKIFGRIRIRISTLFFVIGDLIHKFWLMTSISHVEIIINHMLYLYCHFKIQ